MFITHELEEDTKSFSGLASGWELKESPCFLERYIYIYI